MKAGLLICCHAEGYGLYDDDQYVQYDQYDHFYDLYNLSRRSPIWDSGSITKRMILKMPFTILIMMMMAMMFCFYIQINFSLFNLQFAIILTDAFRQNYFRLFNATDVNNSFPRHLPVLAKSSRAFLFSRQNHLRIV